MSRIEGRIERLHTLYPRVIDLRLERLERLLASLDNPERKLPPVIHVAGTNGKGSVCAFINAIATMAGLRTHVYTSPHLVHFNERICLAGRLIHDDELDNVLDVVEFANRSEPITVFEAITAAAFVAFARTPADLTIIEVGLGGQFDATNVIPPPRAAAITSISLDHQEFLGETESLIAGEKAGIIKHGTSCAVTGAQLPEVLSVLEKRADATGTRLLARGRDWHVTPSGQGFVFEDHVQKLELPRPSLIGAHQLDNAGIAIAALRAAGFLLHDAAFSAGVIHAAWPARMQILGKPYADLLPTGSKIWLDGAHNLGGAQAIAQILKDFAAPVHLIVGMKQGKDCDEFLRIVMPHAASIQAVAEPGQYLALPVDQIIATSGGRALPGPTVSSALRHLAKGGTPQHVLICGSLYLAGVILAHAEQSQSESAQKRRGQLQNNA